MSRDEFIKTALTGFLGRKTPSAAIRSNPDGQRAEISAMLRTIGRYAPQAGVEIWWDRFEDSLVRSMKTHGWPIASEIDAACRAANGADGDNPDRQKMIEAEALKRMTDWHSKFGREMPGHGRADRTQELIRRGVLRDERDARWRGYTLSPDAERRALEMPPTPDETRHHERVLAELKSIGGRE